MGEGVVHTALDTLHEGVQIRMAARIDSECEGIDKEPDESIGLLSGATCHGRANDHIALVSYTSK